ncbi:MAG: sugar phosphate isomerase/epimerase [Pirellulales bacterium]|nr:sugar phosphate isomerase/epimerase [Pirellulales bacterium]
MLASNRRTFLRSLATLTALPALGTWLRGALAESQPDSQMKFGLVTYLWGKDMDLPTLLQICERSDLLGVELRTEHRHGVEPALSKKERAEVRMHFENSPVALVGYGSNAQFHEKDPNQLKKNIELTKSYIHLMHDCGGSGVKVKPNGFPEGVPREKTIEQIGTALRELAAYGTTYGQEIRLEVHGYGTDQLPVIRAIMDVADHPNAKVCWNSNPADLDGDGLVHNFNLVKDRLGGTVHVRELDMDDYPYPQLFDLLKAMPYHGWILLEARTKPDDYVAAMQAQRKRFEELAGH